MYDAQERCEHVQVGLTACAPLELRRDGTTARLAHVELALLAWVRKLWHRVAGNVQRHGHERRGEVLAQRLALLAATGERREYTEGNIAVGAHIRVFITSTYSNHSMQRLIWIAELELVWQVRAIGVP